MISVLIHSQSWTNVVSFKDKKHTAAIKTKTLRVYLNKSSKIVVLALPVYSSICASLLCKLFVFVRLNLVFLFLVFFSTCQVNI